MEAVGKSRFYDKRQLTEALQVADMQIQVLEMTLRQIAEQPSDDAQALQKLAQQALQKAAEVSSTSPAAT
jgi:hypothetical protein